MEIWRYYREKREVLFKGFTHLKEKAGVRFTVNQDTDQEIVDKALNDILSKWKLPKLAKEMGSHYDFSELPTVVYHGDKPVVYDGNRRIILGKMKYGLVTVPVSKKIQLPDFPSEIPCNVCIKKTALENVFRKHGDTGSWQPLERDIFLNKFMDQKKSLFQLLDEATNIIQTNPHLNQRFVRDEIFREDILSEIGFSFENGSMYSRYSDEDGVIILTDISQKVKEKEITTRKNRGKVKEVLEPSSQQLIQQNKEKKFHITRINFTESNTLKKNKRQSRRTPKKKTELFGGMLYLRIGKVSDLYRDIVDLYKFYITNENDLSETFPGVIRMSLRLLCETAAKDSKIRMDDYLKKNFNAAKKTLNQDIKTTLSNQNVTEESITQLLHTGAHTYESSSNIEQTLAISIIIGAILTRTHGRDK